MKRLLLVLWLMVAAVASAQPDTPQTLLEALHQQHGFPGATVAWQGPGDRHGAVAVGLTDPLSQRPMTPTTPMLAASIGKSFVAAALVSASQGGSIELDAPLSRYLGHHSWFPRLPNHQQLTLRHLLNHTAGLPDHVYQPAFAKLFAKASGVAASAPAPEALVALILDQPGRFQPGQGWAYSDTGYLLAAMALEHCLGEPWTSVVNERFITPLALTHTGPSDRPDVPGLAVGMTPEDNDWGLPARTADRDGRLLWHPGIEGAGGGFFSAAPDLARWGRALWSGEVLGKDGTAQLLSSVPIDESLPGRRYGLGVVVESGGPFGEVRGHRGWIPGYVSSLRYYPDHDVAIAIQINTDAGMMGADGALMSIEMAITQEILADTSAAHAVLP